MTALAEGELAQRFPHGKRVHSAENSFHIQMGCENKKTVDQPIMDLVYSLREMDKPFSFFILMEIAHSVPDGLGPA